MFKMMLTKTQIRELLDKLGTCLFPRNDRRSARFNVLFTLIHCDLEVDIDIHFERLFRKLHALYPGIY